jgi:hypothetical protein
MSTFDNWMAIREQCKLAWQFANPPGVGNLSLKCELLNGPTSGVEVVGVTGIVKQQITVCAKEIRDVLKSEYSVTFPFARVKISIGGVVPSPAYPLPHQLPAGPPIFQPPLPPTTPPTYDSKIHCV